MKKNSKITFFKISLLSLTKLVHHHHQILPAHKFPSSQRILTFPTLEDLNFMDILDDLSKAPTSPNSYLTEDPYFPFYTRNHKRSRDENDRVKPWSPLGFLADNITRTLSFNQNPTSASISWFTSKIPNVNKSPL